MSGYRAEFDGVTVESLRAKNCSKWNRYGNEALGAWVADMDFPVCAPIRERLGDMVARSDLGYAPKFDQSGMGEVFASYANRRFGWQIDPTAVAHQVDVVQGIYIMVQAFSEPGDSIVTMTPVYPPFLSSIAETGRRLNPVEWTLGANGYELDMDRLEATCADGPAKLLLLCNPHNPTGRVLTRSELEQIATIAERHDMVVLADEIHADLIFDGLEHVPFMSLGPDVAARTITMTSATKSFNIAGLRTAVMIFGSERMRERFRSVPERFIGGTNAAGLEATRIAWTECDAWLDALVAYLQENRDYAFGRIKQQFTGIDITKPEATFLMWLDCRQSSFADKAHEHFLEVAKVALSDGRDFGPGGEGFVRLNFATSRQVLTQILDQMEASL